MIELTKIKQIYEDGKNINKYLKNKLNLNNNTSQTIEISYDLQAGSYTEAMLDQQYKKNQDLYTKEISNEILSLCVPHSVLEAGIGEGTTFSGVIENLNLSSNLKSYGFDISWSRVAYAKQWLKNENILNSHLCTGDLLNIPFTDNAIDVVYTSHSIEPNGGNEEAILKELYRITNKYLIIIEPAYEFSDEKIQQRMDSHGYCKNLKNIAESLGFKVIKYELFKVIVRDINPSLIIVIKKNSHENQIKSQEVFACPKTKKPLKKIDNIFYSKDSLNSYPIIQDIPCLKVENSVLTTKLEDFNIEKKM